MDKEAVEDALRATVNILYWEAGSDRHECIQISCETFPYFSLSECPLNVQIILGVYGDDEKLIETFDPKQEKWVTHEARMPRDISQCPYLLYRDRLQGPLGILPGDMEIEVEAILKRMKKIQKRLRISRSIDELSDPGPSKRQKRLPPTIKPEPDNEVSLVEAPSSTHARWPLKYVVAMSGGFDRMSSATGTLDQRFEAAFDAPIPPKMTYYDNIKVWNAASRELKEKYISAGYSDAGLWKNFRREVMTQC